MTTREAVRIDETPSLARPACPLCGADEPRLISREAQGVCVVRCGACGLLYLNPRLQEPEKKYWGAKDKYLEEARLIYEGKAPHQRQKNYLQDLDMIAREKPRGRFLDIGTHLGVFLRLASERGWETYGVDPSPTLSELVREQFGLDVRTGFFGEGPAKFPDRFFDVVTMTDVFEHVVNPLQMLREIHRVLKDDGLLFVKVPNGEFNLLKQAVLKRWLRSRRFDIWDANEHVVHYTQTTLPAMLAKGGFTVSRLEIGSPIQIAGPAQRVNGRYQAHAMPWYRGFWRKSGRTVCFALSRLYQWGSGGRVAWTAPNLIAFARKQGVG